MVLCIQQIVSYSVLYATIAIMFTMEGITTAYFANKLMEKVSSISVLGMNQVHVSKLIMS